MNLPLTLKLFLPVIFPSWKFFSSIGPSPRVEYAFLENEEEQPAVWLEFRPRPERVGLWEGLRRLFFNPVWNEFLFLNTCAERLFDEYSPMREREIMRRLLVAAGKEEIRGSDNSRFLIYRISVIIQENNTITQPVIFMAKPASLHLKVGEADV